MEIQTRIEYNKPLASLCSFGLGGTARYFAVVHTIEEMQAFRNFINRENLSYLVIGKGSNIMFDDRGFNGLLLLNNIISFQQKGPCVSVGAGYSFARLGTQISRKGWGGLEFASGIPGSVGGAVYMNAGANGSCVSDYLDQVLVIDKSAQCLQLKASELKFAYRQSAFHNVYANYIIVRADFKVFQCSESKYKQRAIIQQRINQQPYHEKSPGCMFRNPEGLHAGQLIESCGLKGLRIGGAEVSRHHANFLINCGSATTHEVLTLCATVQRIVKKQTGIYLEREVKVIPWDMKSQ